MDHIEAEARQEAEEILKDAFPNGAQLPEDCGRILELIAYRLIRAYRAGRRSGLDEAKNNKYREMLEWLEPANGQSCRPS